MHKILDYPRLRYLTLSEYRCQIKGTHGFVEVAQHTHIAFAAGRVVARMNWKRLALDT